MTWVSLSLRMVLRVNYLATSSNVMISQLFVCKPKLLVMILPQVHLRKPCYDFYFL
jgi:hypothetical protein